MTKLKGKVAWFNASKGYGFIQSHCNPGRDIFVHYTQIEGPGFKTLAENQEVEFTLQEGPKGPAALEVVKLVKKFNEFGNLIENEYREEGYFYD